MTMQQFYQQLVLARRQPAGPLGPLARLTRAGLGQVRRLQSRLQWVSW